MKPYLSKLGRCLKHRHLVTIPRECYGRRKANGWTTDRLEETVETTRLARRAVDLGKEDAVALSTGGFALAFVVGDLDDGAACIDRALALNPNLAAAWSVIPGRSSADPRSFTAG